MPLTEKEIRILDSKGFAPVMDGLSHSFVRLHPSMIPGCSIMKYNLENLLKYPPWSKGKIFINDFRQEPSTTTTRRLKAMHKGYEYLI